MGEPDHQTKSLKGCLAFRRMGIHNEEQQQDQTPMARSKPFAAIETQTLFSFALHLFSQNFFSQKKQNVYWLAEGVTVGAIVEMAGHRDHL